MTKSNTTHTRLPHTPIVGTAMTQCGGHRSNHWLQIAARRVEHRSDATHDYAALNPSYSRS